MIEGPTIVVGTTYVEKAKLYGWAVPPNRRMPPFDPDTNRTRYFWTNSSGWKDVEHELAKPQGVFRILFIGDSYTYGVVMLEELYTRKVEKMLHDRGHRNIEVISMGVGGWGTEQSLEALTNEGVKYDPDLVIYQFCSNDLCEILQLDTQATPTALARYKPFRYELRNGKLTKISVVPSKENIISKAKKAHNRFFAPGAVDPGMPEYATHNPAGDSPAINSAWLLFEALLDKMKQVSHTADARFIVFSESGDTGFRHWNLRWKRFQVDADGDHVMQEGKRYPIDWDVPLKRLAEICERHKIPLIKPVRTYHRFKNNPHANAAGNIAMAQDIVQFLQEHSSLLPPLRVSR